MSDDGITRNEAYRELIQAVLADTARGWTLKRLAHELTEHAKRNGFLACTYSDRILRYYQKERVPENQRPAHLYAFFNGWFSKILERISSALGAIAPPGASATRATNGQQRNGGEHAPKSAKSLLFELNQNLNWLSDIRETKIWLRVVVWDTLKRPLFRSRCSSFASRPTSACTYSMKP